MGTMKYIEQQVRWLKKAAKAVATKHKQYDQWWPLYEAAAEVLGLPGVYSTPEYMPSPSQVERQKEAIQKTWSPIERLIRERFVIDDKEDIEKYLQLEEYTDAERMVGQDDEGGQGPGLVCTGDGGRVSRSRADCPASPERTTDAATGGPARPQPKRLRPTQADTGPS